MVEKELCIERNNYYLGYDEVLITPEDHRSKDFEILYKGKKMNNVKGVILIYPWE